jgi:hypothetical protein
MKDVMNDVTMNVCLFTLLLYRRQRPYRCIKAATEIDKKLLSPGHQTVKQSSLVGFHPGPCPDPKTLSLTGYHPILYPAP